jgi:hypothetical protein
MVSTLLAGNPAAAGQVKVAFVGDQGVGEHAQAVLSLIANEGTDLLLIQGDLGYEDNAALNWEANLTNALGADFPVLTLVGNHENYEWPKYQELIKRRIERAAGVSCTGLIGVKAFCHYGNMDIVQVSPGITEVQGVDANDNYTQFISSSFAQSTAPWRICSWHKNQNRMQTGNKSDATGWNVYDACLNVGALIAMGHEHAYSRTYLLSDYRKQVVAHRNSEMTLEPGRSFAFVSGLGGREVRPQVQGGDWWASVYTATQDATHGALFCTFATEKAECYFKAIDGAVPDQFSLISNVGSKPGNVTAVATTSLMVPSAGENSTLTTVESSVNVQESISPDPVQVPPNEKPVTAESGSNAITTVSVNGVAPLISVPSVTDALNGGSNPPPQQIELASSPGSSQAGQIDQGLSAQTTDASPLALLTDSESTAGGVNPAQVSVESTSAANLAGQTAATGGLSVWLLVLLLSYAGLHTVQSLLRRTPRRSPKSSRLFIAAIPCPACRPPT